LNGVEGIISELEQQRDGIDRALAALREVVGGSAAPAVAKRRGRPPGSKNRGGNTEAEAGKARSEGQRRRWAEKRAAAGTGTGHGLTTVGRKKLAAKKRG
jgi:hypothetical protein